MNYTVGQRVRDRYDRNFLGRITKIEDVDDIYVQWDQGSHSLCDSSDLRPVDVEADKAKAARVQAKINEAAQSLEAAFKAWKQAAEEYDVGEAYGMKHDPLLDLSEFEGILQRNGWSTSSLYC